MKASTHTMLFCIVFITILSPLHGMNYIKSVYSSASKAHKKVINKIREAFNHSPFLPNEMLAHIVEQAQDDPNTVARLSEVNYDIFRKEVEYQQKNKNNDEASIFIVEYMSLRGATNNSAKKFFLAFLKLSPLTRKEVFNAIRTDDEMSLIFRGYRGALTPKQAKKLIHRNRKMPEALLRLCLNKIIIHEPYCTVTTLLDILGTTSNKQQAIKILALPLGKAILKNWPVLLNIAAIYTSLYLAD